MESEEDEIRSRLPELYQIIASSVSDINWSEVHDDLENLNWLHFDMTKAMNILEYALDIIDLVSLTDSDGNSRHNILQHNRVLLFLNRFVFEMTNEKKSLKLLASQLKKKIDSFIFFKSAKNSLLSVDDENLVQLFKYLSSTFQIMQDAIVNIFSSVDNAFKQEAYQSIEKYLIEAFLNNVYSVKKSMLKQIPEIKRLIDSKYNAYSSVKSNGGMWSAGGGYYSTSSRENDYFGEVDDHGNRHGYGKITFCNGDKYDGYWKDDNMHGKGIYFWKEGGRYEGEFHDGKIQGIGKRLYCSGNVYEGSFVNNKKEGRGIMRYKSGDIYEGEWKDDDMHGEGVYNWSSGDVYRGRFKGDRREGKGTLTLASGEVYEAEWRDDKMNGRAPF